MAANIYKLYEVIVYDMPVYGDAVIDNTISEANNNNNNKCF